MNPEADPLAQYLDSLRHERRLSDHTLRGYTHELAELKALAGARPVAELSASDVRGAVVRAHAQGLSSRSLAHRLSVWRSFYRWLALHVSLPANPVGTIRAPRRPKALPKALSVDDACALMEAPHEQSVEALRDHAMLELFYSSGLRLAELVGLDVQYTASAGYECAGWLDLAAAEVTVTGKGNRRRTVPVGSQAVAALRAWLAVRGQALGPGAVQEGVSGPGSGAASGAGSGAGSEPQALFLSARGKRMSPNSVRARIKRLALVAGIPANVHPHVLRHSFATHVLQSSGDLRAVQELLGHASIAATQVYTSLDFQHLARVYDQTHPRAKKRD